MSATKKVWFILIQRRADGCTYRYPNNSWGRGGKRQDQFWPNFREWAAWPVLFHSKSEAEAYMRECFTYKRLHGHKMSASVTHISFFKRLRAGYV